MQDPDWKVKLLCTLRNAFGGKRVPVPNKFSPPMREMHASWLPQGISTVIDVGAHVGEFASMMRSLLPTANIISFEPQAESYKKLQENMNGDQRFSSFNVALGSEHAMLDMYQNAFTPCSSLLPMTWKGIASYPFTIWARRQSVLVKRLDEMVDASSLQGDVLLKIDTQGYEDHVIAGAEKLLDRIKYILLEVSFVKLYKEQKLFPEIKAMLESKGFSYVRPIMKMKTSFTSEVVQEDALFQRM
jgi:FkbM family methyltransferase